jgi:hypothetical protein
MPLTSAFFSFIQMEEGEDVEDADLDDFLG